MFAWNQRQYLQLWGWIIRHSCQSSKREGVAWYPACGTLPVGWRSPLRGWRAAVAADPGRLPCLRGDRVGKSSELWVSRVSLVTLRETILSAWLMSAISNKPESESLLSSSSSFSSTFSCSKFLPNFCKGSLAVLGLVVSETLYLSPISSWPPLASFLLSSRWSSRLPRCTWSNIALREPPLSKSVHKLFFSIFTDKGALHWPSVT